MCVFNRVMVDSGTIGFIASQEMARNRRVEGLGAWRRGVLGVQTTAQPQECPGCTPVQVTASVQCPFFRRRRAGWDTEQCQPGPKPGK